MVSIIIGGAVLLGALALLYGFANAKPAAVKSSVVWGLGTLGAVSLALMLFTGRGANALWALVMFGPALRQAWRGWRARHTFSRPAGPSGGDASGVETATLEMRLDLASGAMSGLVRRGAFSGRELAALDQAQLIELLEDCRVQDAESIP
ncbi:MAG: hypothetical protein JWR10_1772, partial [Rubritepida sp.]|nr:hypothetical protein [Rubritepida sp.]